MKQGFANSAAWLLLAVVCATSMEFYTFKIWSANQPDQFSDLYASWWAAHEMLLHRRNPYSSAVAHEIQTVIYGTPTVGSAEDPESMGGGFAYPPYVALFLWPTVYLPFRTAQNIFVCFSIFATVLSLALWLRMLRLHWPRSLWLAATVFSLGSFPVLEGLKLQNPSLIAAALVTITIFLLAADRLALAGIFLALATCKPQFTIALIPWLAAWTVVDWRRRRLLAGSFFIAILALVLASEWLVPGWIHDFLHVIRAYRHYTYGHSILDVWFSPTCGPWIAAGLMVAVLTFCRPQRRDSADSPQFLLATSLLLAVTLVVIPTLAPHTQLLLLPGFLCLIQNCPSIRASRPLLRLSAAAAWMLLAWPWIAAFGLLVVAAWVPTVRLLRFWQVPLYTSPIMAFAVASSLASALRNRSRAFGRRSEPSFP